MASRCDGTAKLSPITTMLSRLALVLGLCVLLGVTACQSSTLSATPPPQINTISFGQTVRGNLDQGESRWLFVGSHTETVAIEFTASEALPPVTLIDPGGESVARISTSTGRLDRFRLLSDGKYTIVVGSGTGSYTLVVRTLTLDAPTATLAPTTRQTIALGDQRFSTLNADENLWSFEGKAGTILTLQMNVAGGSIDPALRLFAPDGSLVASDDNSGGGLNAMISGVKLPTTGTYLIQASGGGQTGDYTLMLLPGTIPLPTPLPTVTLAAPTPIQTAAPTTIPIVVTGSQIRIGQTIASQIPNPSYIDRFAVFGPAGTVISIGMFRAAGSKLVPSFQVYAPNGKQVAQAAGVSGAIVSGFVLPVTGAYIIYPQADQNRSSGLYTLTVGEGLILRDVDAGAVTPDLPTQGKLERTGDRQNWTLNIPANATFTVEVAPLQSGVAPLVDVLTLDGKVLGTAQFAPATRTIKTGALLSPIQGAYHVRVAAAAGSSGGGYSLLVRVLKIIPTAVFSVALDQTMQAEVQQDERYTYSFKAVPGIVALIEVHGKDQFDPVVEVYGPDGHRLDLTDDSSVDNTDAVVQLSLDDGIGTYTVQVHGYAMTPGTFTLHVKTE
ncbi:MAG: PPC domain-containing protein [Chloroflexota bacterium]